MKKKKLLKFKIIPGLATNIKRSCILLFLFILSGCKVDHCQNISGTWSISEIKVNKKDFFQYLEVNTFRFRCKDNSASFPGSYFFNNDQKAKWDIIEKNGTIDSLKIYSEIKIFNNKFKVDLDMIEETKQFHLLLKSDNVYISAYKILDDY